MVSLDELEKENEKERGDRDSVIVVIAKYIYMKSVEIDHSKKNLCRDVCLGITSHHTPSYPRKP